MGRWRQPGWRALSRQRRRREGFGAVEVRGRGLGAQPLRALQPGALAAVLLTAPRDLAARPAAAVDGHRRHRPRRAPLFARVAARRRGGRRRRQALERAAVARLPAHALRAPPAGAARASVGDSAAPRGRGLAAAPLPPFEAAAWRCSGGATQARLGPRGAGGRTVSRPDAPAASAARPTASRIPSIICTTSSHFALPKVTVVPRLRGPALRRLPPPLPGGLSMKELARRRLDRRGAPPRPTCLIRSARARGGGEGGG